ncbi:MAG: glycosyltransferase family 9 protein [Vicinamibacteria bacterium]|nr:glycosyltransferase family 9 protein [Vicinamibacteria bacterium]
MSLATSLFKWTDRVGGGLAVRALGLAHHHLRPGPPFVDIDPRAVRRVLLVRPGGIGDLLLLLPAVQRLRTALPGVELTLIAQRRNASLAELSGAFDHVACFDGSPATFARALRRGHDVAIDSEQFHYSSAAFAFLSGARARIGFKINPARNELYTHLVDYPMDLHESVAFARLVEPLCGAADAAGPVPTLAGVLDRGRLPERVDGVPAAAGRVVVFPYGGGRGKEWPTPRWTEVVRRLRAAGHEVALVGGSDARPRAEAVLAGLGGDGASVLDLVGRLSLRDTAAVVAQARLYVGCDTGVTHVAQALGVRCVVLFGASDERKWGPPPELGQAVSEPVPCRPCAIFGYVKRCRTIDCMNRIAVDRVWRAVEAELAASAQ